jgi:hypothetical protein
MRQELLRKCLWRAWIVVLWITVGIMLVVIPILFFCFANGIDLALYRWFGWLPWMLGR